MYKKIPDSYVAKIVSDLGRYPDEKIAKKWSKKITEDVKKGIEDGIKDVIDLELKIPFTITRQAIHNMRTKRGIKPYLEKPYTKPKFRGPVEHKYPIDRLLGKYTYEEIAKSLNVSMSAINSAARRLNYKAYKAPKRDIQSISSEIKTIVAKYSS